MNNNTENTNTLPRKKVLYLVNIDWFFLSHRLPIALAAIDAGYEVHLLCGISNKLEELESHGLILHNLPINRSKINLFQEIQTILKIIKTFKAIKPDLVHLVTIKPVLYGGIIARVFKTQSVVAAISGMGFIFSNHDWKTKLKRSLVSFTYKKALKINNLKVIFQNPIDQDTLTNIVALHSSQFTLIPGSGVDLSTYSISDEPTSDVPIVVLAARLLHDKGVNEFIDAAQTLKMKKIHARFCLIGAPDPDNPNSVTNNELTIWVNEGIVESWGHRSDMPNVLSNANLVVLPSYYGEGLPKILIEAAACGRAIITTDMPGCRDSITPDVTGLLIPARDSEALASAIERLLTDKDLRVRMGQAGRKLAENKYSIEQVIKTHIDIYNELLNKNNPKK